MVKEYELKEDLTALFEQYKDKHLEIQRQAMLMYTSCGWFFSEISGIETVQIMKYAARVMQLAKSFVKKDFESKLNNFFISL